MSSGRFQLSEAFPLIMILFLQYITVSAFASAMININNRKDERISECFPNDPYSNICIATTTQKLYLQHAFLSMDSGFFARIDPDAHEVDLRDRQEEPLIRILHSLYGEELIANSVSELAQLLPIILYLEIQQYRKNVEKELLSKRALMENVQLLQIAYRNKFLWEEISKVHIQSNLSLLENAKSYLQLGKVENDTFNCLMMQFIEKTGVKHEKIMNNVMENYFNRKGIKAIPYLQSYNQTLLLKIWMNYHHALQMITPTIHHEAQSTKKIETVTPQMRIQEKQKKVKMLEDQIASKDLAIRKLMHDIQSLKSELGIRQKLATAKSLFINSQYSDNPSSKEKVENQRRSKASPAFKSCIYTEKNDERRSSSKRKTFNRFGSKNLKRWA